jgi:ABC-2 type transport system ATP-binding protein
MSPSDPVIALAAVVKRFGAATALRGISLEVAKGEMFGLIGPDGAGKTTTLRMTCGLIRPDAGSVRVMGADPWQARRVATAAIGYVSQRFSLYGDLSVDENIAFFARLHGVRDFEARRTRLLELTRLLPFRDRLADRLSGGMKQKLALACTLVHEPPLLVLDEPTTGVDPVSRREFWKLLAEFLTQGLTIVMATPYLDEAERCSRVALLHEGRVLAMATPAELQASSHGLVAEIVAAPPRRALGALRARFGEERVQLFGDRVHLRIDRAPEAQAAAEGLSRDGIAVASVRAIAPTLEDVFIERLTDAGRQAERSVAP